MLLSSDNPPRRRSPPAGVQHRYTSVPRKGLFCLPADYISTMLDDRAIDPAGRPPGEGEGGEWLERLTRRTDLTFDADVVETTDDGPVSVMDITFAGIGGERVQAYQVIPSDRDRFGTVLFVHPGPGNRSNFLSEATRLAGTGIASFLVEAPWAAGDAWVRTLGTPERNREVFIDAIRGLSRALDVAIAHSGVDPDRVACVGHSMGALCAAVLAGVDPRCRACVLIAGAPSFTDVALGNLPMLAGDELAHYREVMAPIDPLTFIGRVAPAPLFFQFGERDRVFSRERSEAFAAGAGDPKLVRWYDTDHAFESEEARRDRLEWLQARLGTGYRRMKGATGRPPVRRR